MPGETIRYYARGAKIKKYEPTSAYDRALLHNAQRQRCYLCGELFSGRTNTESKFFITTDHVWPRDLGGNNFRNGRNNRLLAHKQCNEKKGERKPYPCELLYLEAINLKIEYRP